MNRRHPVLPLLLTTALVAGFGTACGGDEGTLDAGAIPDAGAAPDASTPRPRPDAGPPDPQPVPTISNVSPRTGPETGLTRVTLRGSNFTEPAEVFFGDTPATSVVVLDEVSIAATAPAGAIGPVTVRVVTPGGEAELPDGFTYVRELRLDAVSPARVPDEGGVQVTLTGRGFDASTLVFFDRVPMRGLTVENETTIVGYVPALRPGRPEIRVVHPEAGVRRSDLLFVFGTPEVTALAPGWGTVDGGDPQEAIGDGLDDANAVTVGGESAAEIAFEGERLGFDAPRQVEGVHDVVVANDDAQGVLRGGYIAVDPNVAGAAILGATPNRVSTDGGEQVTIVGRGFDASTQVAIGALRVPVVSLDANAIVITVPAGLAVGPVDVQIFTASDSLDGAGLLTVYQPMTVDGISPDRGPASGGTAVRITGTGFVAGVEVRIADVPLADVQVVSDTEITARTVAGAGGVHDVVVRGPEGRATLADAFTFEEPFEIIRVEPNEGSIAGNTYVTVLGRGFTGEAAVQFGGIDGLAPVVENGGVIGVRTQPNPSGRVDVDVQIAGGQARLPLAFEFYDPRLVTGGAWGGAIEGSVNVALMNFNGDPLPGMVVQLGYEADPRYRGVTDDNGLATISSPEIRGAQTVTAGGVDVEFVTFMELNARNLTMIASAHPSIAPPDAPVFPCPPDPPPAPAVTGRIFKFKSPLDPVSRPGWQPLVQITYTQPSVFATNPPEPPTQTAFVFADGQEYRIDVMRAGTVAVYAILGDYNPETQQFEPRRMGIARSVPVAPGVVTENIDIDLDIPLTASTLLRLDDPPDQAPNPTINAIFPFLNMGSDGVIPFPVVAIQGDGAILIDGLPAVAEDEFIYMGGSFAWDQTTGQLRNPYSLNLVETAAPFEEGVDLGPYLEMPQNVRPKAGELIVNGELSWDQGGPTPDITVINVVDIGAAGGQCCIDANMNGQCDDGEPLQGGALPQQFNRWSIYGEGGLQSYHMPPMPAPLQAFEPPRAYGYLIQQAIAPRFDYREFIYNQFSPAFWRSWMVFDSNFTVKEETD